MDQREFVRTFQPLLPKVSAYLNRRVATQDVEDVASKVFEIAWAKRKACPEGHELAWLYKICSNVVSNERRKQRNIWQLAELFESDHAAPSAEDLAIANISLRHAIASLKASDRQIIALFAIDGLKLGEIAIALGISANSATQRLKRARARLAAELEEK